MKYARWPKPGMATCGLGRQPDCFVSMEFDLGPTNRNPGSPFRSAVWLLYSPGFSIFSMQYVGDTLRMTVLGCAVALIYMLRRRSDAATKAMHETKVAQQALAKQTLEARLQLMEAQIEPHFLFNSLANVQRLYETQPELGEQLIEDLKIYLRAALPQMREARTTLGREAELSRAYLGVLKARMGDRLHFKVDVPAGLVALDGSPFNKVRGL